MSKGFIYILRNEAFGSLLKIGFSSKVPEARAKELSSTGVPSPFSVSYYCLTDQARSVELTVHKILDKFRYSKNREFFEINIHEAVKCIHSLCKPEYEWSDQILLKSSDGMPLNLKDLGYKVNGIKICSRRDVDSQIYEMVNFCELAQDRGISKYIVSMLYCSNSDCCSIDVKSRMIIRALFEKFRMGFMPLLHRHDGWFGVQS
jgi:hypothetical protein